MPEDTKEAEHQDGSPRPDDVAPAGEEIASGEIGDVVPIDDGDLAPVDDVDVSVAADVSSSGDVSVDVSSSGDVSVDVSVAADVSSSGDVSVDVASAADVSVDVAALDEARVDDALDVADEVDALDEVDVDDVDVEDDVAAADVDDVEDDAADGGETRDGGARVDAATDPSRPRAASLGATAEARPPRAATYDDAPAEAGGDGSGAPALAALDAPDARAASALTSSGASQLPPAPIETIEAVAAAVGRLRAEVAATTDKARKARLLHEAAEIQERGGDEPGAARDYLAAYNADTSFREPLEGLVRLLERRRSLSNLGKLIEALVASAVTPEERARALTQRALFVEDVQKDLEGARGLAREATETGADAADLGPAWLALEMAAAKLGDAAQREEALAGRAELTDDPTWRGLLLVDVARLAASSGDVERALGILARAREEGGGAAFQAAAAVERIFAADPGLPGTDDARARGRALADALEARAEMILAAMSDAQAGDARGVPRHCRSVEHVIDLFFRAADARRLASELGRASQLLDRALAVLGEAAEKDAPRDEPTASGEGARDAASTVERVVLTARLRLAELAGDTALAAELAEKRSVGETDGGVAASLAMRVAEHAASEGDVPRALEALTRATERDPASSPARALKIDILEGSGDGARFAAELEELSRHCTTGEAQGRALLLAAYVWATRAESAARAREALGQAAACGVPKETVARLGRTLASLRSDHTWYEDATRELVEHASGGAEGAGGGGASEAAAELPRLWIELARIRLGQGDDAGAAKATAALRELPEGAWLGRVLDGLASPEIDPARARTALEELAAGVEDASLRRSLGVVCALRSRAAGDEAAAIAHL
ncbi:MAG: hypothetical protein KF782_32990, partial [Labilithrix sp.]|nr:hypothetical protein [Labilithrix sp.]